MTLHSYEVFGLSVHSQIALPELQSAPAETEPDVVVHLAKIDPGQVTSDFHAHDGLLQFEVADVGRFQISNGSRIVVEPAPGAIDKNVTVYVLGSAFGAILHQRGLLPLHANAIEIGGCAIAVAGQSGAGKSTLAGWFEDQGARVIADDVCVLGFNEAGPFTRAGVRRLRLSPEAVKSRGLEPSAFPASFVGNPHFDKLDIPLRERFAPGAEVPLAAVYVLDVGDETSIASIDGIEAVEEAFAHTYRGGFVPMLGVDRSHWEACVRLVSQVRFFRFTRRWSLEDMDDQNRLLLRHATDLIG